MIDEFIFKKRDIDEDGCITEKHRTVGSELSRGIYRPYVQTRAICGPEVYRPISTGTGIYVAAIFKLARVIVLAYKA